MTDPRNQAERRAHGKSLRKDAARSSHGQWSAPADRPDPVDVITSQNASRLQSLVPIRHWRMAQSPFTFYRGAAKLMALDLATTPVTGLTAQICGDAHLSNFGVYGSPERELVFDINDFDETLPGPWEWDVKRLCASFAIAARHRGFDKQQQALATEAAAAYRQATASFAEMSYLDAWYSRINTDDIYQAFADQMTKKEAKRGRKFIAKSKGKDSLHALSKLAEQVDGSYRIVAQPPLIVPLRDILEAAGTELSEETMKAELEDYLASVPDHMEVLLGRYTPVDSALKVVGVGSVGTRSAIVLLQGRDADDPLFLQVKEAGRSVLEDHLPASKYENHGQRVVEGQRLMQAASDSFLGWNRGQVTGTHYYWRQLKDMKASPDIDKASADALSRYARLCGWTLARAHSRSGSATGIAGYLGSGKVFDRALGDFAVAYADQNESDFTAFEKAIESGRIEAHE
ncbi:MAG: DUF2252 domain-containing protein [Acidimicrobiia bacterium]|nr:MAG: DUF2252 domain-containing protein [Acidimicrobiia bacterium]